MIAPRQRKPTSKDFKRLTARSVAAAKTGRYHDGMGLYLIVSKSGSAKWSYRYTRPDTHRVTEFGIGSATTITLSEARERAHEARRLIASGGNPVADRRAARQHKASRKSFGEIAYALIAAKESGWRSEKHRLQWRSSLSTYAEPLWGIPVDEIDVSAVLAALRPIWKTIPETASRVRGRIEAVLDAAKAQGLRTGENPASWKGNLKHRLQERSKIERKNFAALPYQEVPRFVARLREIDSVASLALQFVEGCLAHVTGSAVARSYRRGDVLTKRRAVLEAWSIFCTPAAGADVIPMRTA